MSGRWYKRCGADFIHGTFNLSLEEKGAYSLCLDLIYDRGGPIPDDARWLSGICGVSLRKWNALRERLISEGKLYAENGFLSNVRADFELVSSQFHAKKLAESGAKGGRKRAENAAKTNKNNDIGQATLKHIREDKKRIEHPLPPQGGEDWFPHDDWAAFVRMRKSIKKPMTQDAIVLAGNKLDELRGKGFDPAAVLQQSVLNSWQGLFELRKGQEKSLARPVC